MGTRGGLQCQPRSRLIEYGRNLRAMKHARQKNNSKYECTFIVNSYRNIVNKLDIRLIARRRDDKPGMNTFERYIFGSGAPKKNSITMAPNNERLLEEDPYISRGDQSRSSTGWRLQKNWCCQQYTVRPSSSILLEIIPYVDGGTISDVDIQNCIMSRNKRGSLISF